MVEFKRLQVVLRAPIRVRWLGQVPNHPHAPIQQKVETDASVSLREYRGKYQMTFDLLSDESAALSLLGALNIGSLGEIANGPI